MNTEIPPNQLLSQVNQFWSLLDDMAESSPQSYQKFIQRHLEEGREFMSPPDPHLCLQTKILDPEEHMLFINICGWKRVPCPESDGHPVPLIAGKLKDTSDGAVISIAYSPEVLAKADKDPTEQDQLIRLAMKYIEQHHKVPLCHSYRVAPFNLKGTIQQMRNALQATGVKPEKTKEKTQDDPDRSLLEQLKNMAVKGEDKEEPKKPLEITNKTKPKVGLIEVISSTELNEEEPLPSPQHELSVMKDNSGNPQTIILMAQLQGVCSISSCDLNVSKDDLMLEVPGKYRLHLDLPELVNEETVTAKYHKANGTLTVTMTLL
ncbi:PIH1 domain-containing protein 2 [Eleutherodactylus coqui]|uniref:PIH1 domain-containing protein 2 n=1 Tax=Eleutherodactylus coqui TaxID=57060 RepID=UPI0034622846